MVMRESRAVKAQTCPVPDKSTALAAQGAVCIVEMAVQAENYIEGMMRTRLPGHYMFLNYHKTAVLEQWAVARLVEYVQMDQDLFQAGTHILFHALLQYFFPQY